MPFFLAAATRWSMAYCHRAPIFEARILQKVLLCSLQLKTDCEGSPMRRRHDPPPPSSGPWVHGGLHLPCGRSVPSNPAKDSHLCHPRPGAVAHGRREIVPRQRRRRHDPPPPRSAATAAARSRPQSWRAGPNVPVWRPRLGSQLCTHHRRTPPPQTCHRSTFTSPAPPIP